MTAIHDLGRVAAAPVQPPTAQAIGVTVTTCVAVGLLAAGVFMNSTLSWAAYAVAVASSAGAILVGREDRNRQKSANYAYGTPIRRWLGAVRTADLLVVAAATAHLAWEAAK